MIRNDFSEDVIVGMGYFILRFWLVMWWSLFKMMVTICAFRDWLIFHKGDEDEMKRVYGCREDPSCKMQSVPSLIL